MGGYVSNLGNAAAQYEAQQSSSPIVRALFKKAAGPSTQDTGVQLANAIAGRYRRTPVADPNDGMYAQQPVPIPDSSDDEVDTAQTAAPVTPQTAATVAPQQDSSQSAPPANQPKTNTGLLGAAMHFIPGMAYGGFSSGNELARVAESGPEVAGGRIVTNPSIVKLDKGDSVIPLTPRPGNKLQPDLLEGHLAAPKVPGVQFSRYKSYGQGRGLMR